MRGDTLTRGIGFGRLLANGRPGSLGWPLHPPLRRHPSARSRRSLTQPPHRRIGLRAVTSTTAGIPKEPPGRR